MKSEEMNLYGLVDCFCGGRETEGEIDLQENSGLDWHRYSVVCFKCGTKGIDSGNRVVAIEHWNRGGRQKKIVLTATIEGYDFTLDIAKATGKFVVMDTTV